jgi:molybdopterin-guanine dinucleotide biosynthesis protein A
MKVVILVGGLGTRLQEETAVKPKPMIEIGGKPIEIYDATIGGKLKIFPKISFEEAIKLCSQK